MADEKLNQKEIADKWQKKWEEKQIFKISENSDKPKYYLLEMFPYPSGSGLHMGHALNYTLGDIFARFKRMQGFNVLYPMGFDSFGLPAENAAIKAKAHPRKFTEEAIQNYIKQMKGLGLSYDWDRMVQTHTPEYYKWDQWIFLQMYKKGLVYKKESGVNWCPKCNTVLANEQVHNGKCWRHEDTNVEVKKLNQWYLKITAYADELFEGIKKLENWPETIKKLQTNWINKSYGSEVHFEINNNKTIFVDAVHALVDEEGNVNEELKEYLDSLPNKKIVLTNAKKELHKKLFSKIDYEIFTLEFNPAKEDPKYYELALKKYNLTKNQVVYFEHGIKAKESAESIGIKTHFYDQDVNKVKEFLKNDLVSNWPVFTTRPDTLMGVTFVVVAAQHPKLDSLVTKEQRNEVEEFKQKIHSVKAEDVDKLEKEGVFTGSYAIHPLTKEKIPVYAGNFVLADYGSGMVMAVPAHDQRDFEFAKKYSIPIKYVIKPKNQNCVIVHGSNSSESSSTEGKPENERHWKPWLKQKLEKVGMNVSNELYPKDWEPDYEEWKKIFEKNDINENTTLIGHSAGTAFILRYLSETNKNIHKVILVAPAYVQVDRTKRLEKLYEFKINSKLKKTLQDLTIIVSDNDEEDIIESAKEIHKILGGNLIEFKEKGHFTESDMGTNEFPELLKEVINQKQAFTEYGILVNSGEFNNLESEVAKKKITEKLESLNKGKQTINFRLRDWLISRQRYWGTPIPIYYDENNEPKPVPDELLPITLPEDVVFEEGKGNPLKTSKTHKIKINGKEYKLETDTMDTFVNSSWYYLRYTDPTNNEQIFNSKNANYWAPVDTYIGGKEHACMHLIYIRFYTKFLRDLGLLNFDEPAKRLFNQGMLQGPDGEKMSKSKGNVILPEVVSEKFGLDSARMFLVSQASPDKDINWSDTGTEGSQRFLNKLYSFITNFKESKTNPKVKSKLYATIKNVENNIENLKYNLAIIQIRELFDHLDKGISKEDLESYLKLLAPFCPHVTEELWELIGNKNFLSLETWPKYDEKLINEKLDYLDETIDNLKEDIRDVLKLIKVENPKEIKLIISNSWKYEFVKMFKETIQNTRNPKDIISNIMQTDLKKYSKDIMKMIPAFLKDESKLPKEIINLDDEFKNLDENLENLKSEFNCNILIEKADESKEQKANNAIPGKPAILVN
ncbi:HAD-IA family hydrolase [Candidatus Woesearchaeota archaeon]|nr:HAD-IA family hydrolase [Candidatus Woesearchaeota archaeon]MCF8012982.1 HAD-IA family hydrolase [Candidatus Woesearchaeota archaeon]